MSLSDLPGKVKVPLTVPLGLFVMSIVAVTLGWADIHNRMTQMDIQAREQRETTARAIAEAKSRDAEMAAAVATMRDQAVTRQEAILTRLTRIETHLEQIMRQNAVQPR